MREVYLKSNEKLVENFEEIFKNGKRKYVLVDDLGINNWKN